MKSLIKIVVFSVPLLAMMSVSCTRLDQYPPEPTIKFTQFEKLYNAVDSIYDRGILEFEYTDGDGDLGLDPGDTFPPLL